jgi:mannosylglycerate hydrolase
LGAAGAVERPAPTGQHYRFVDITDGRRGLAILPRGLLEHEVTRHDGKTELALTLVRSVGWLSRGDLAVIDHAAGPIMATPAAQELGAHRFEYAVLLHDGDWQKGDVMTEARRFASPPIAVSPGGKHGTPLGRAVVEVSPTPVTLSAVHPSESGLGVVVRIVNTSPTAQTATLKPGFAAKEALLVDPLERVRDGRVEWKSGTAALQLRPWEIATLLFRG